MTMNVKLGKAMAQARQIARRKTPNGKANAIHVWSIMVKEAMRGDVSVRGVQPEPGADVDAGLGATVRGADGVEDAGPDRARVPAESAGAPR